MMRVGLVALALAACSSSSAPSSSPNGASCHLSRECQSLCCDVLDVCSDTTPCQCAGAADCPSYTGTSCQAVAQTTGGTLSLCVAGDASALD